MSQMYAFARSFLAFPSNPESEVRTAQLLTMLKLEIVKLRAAPKPCENMAI